MFWAVVAVAGIGLLCGFWNRVSVLVLASTVTLVVGVIFGPLIEGWSVVVVAKTFAMLFALQGGFLVGAGVRFCRAAGWKYLSFDAIWPHGG